MADRYCTRCDGLQRTSPNAVPCTRCNGTGYEPGNAPQPPSGASVSKRARELLAAEYERGGKDGAYPSYAELARQGRGEFTKCALRALEQALTQQRGKPNGKLVGWWNGIMPDVTGRSPYGPSVRWGADAENSGHDIPLYDGYNPIHYTTPQPSADAVREVPEGMVLVPREPTDRMVDAYVEAVNTHLGSLTPKDWEIERFNPAESIRRVARVGINALLSAASGEGVG